jgi:membrane-associated phospholipid phosphatase
MSTPSDSPNIQTTPHQALHLQLFVGFLACAIGLLFFGLLAYSVINSTSMVQFDQNVAVSVRAWATPPLTRILYLVTLLGLQGLWIVVIVVAGYFLIKHRRAHLVTWLVAVLGAELLNAIMKAVVARPRPVLDDPLLTAANYSFPSGHAMISVVVYGLLAYFIMENLHSVLSRTAVMIAAILLILLIGLSRIYLGVHFFSDVAAGYAAGAAWLAICISAMSYFTRRVEGRTASPNPTRQPAP